MKKFESSWNFQYVCLPIKFLFRDNFKAPNYFFVVEDTDRKAMLCGHHRMRTAISVTREGIRQLWTAVSALDKMIVEMNYILNCGYRKSSKASTLKP